MLTRTAVVLVTFSVAYMMYNPMTSSFSFHHDYSAVHHQSFQRHLLQEDSSTVVQDGLTEQESDEEPSQQKQ